MTTTTPEDTENFYDAISATMRALSEQHDADLQDLESQKYGTDIRGDADRYAFWRRYHDPVRFRENCPIHPDARDAFAILEAARCEVLGAGDMRGVQANILQAITADRAQSLTENDDLYAASWYGLSEITRPKDVSYKGQEVLDRHLGLMAQALGDPAAYGVMAQALLQDLGFDISRPDLPEGEGQNTDQSDIDTDEQGDGGEEGADNTSAQDQTALEKMMAMAAAGAADANAKDMQSISKTQMSMLGDMGEAESVSEPDQSASEDMPQYARQFAAEMGDYSYKIHTTEFDMVEYADRMASREELHQLRGYLDETMAATQRMIGQFAAKLQRYILARQKHAWQYSYDTGLLDHKRLSQVVINPDNPLCYKQSHDAPFRDTVVSLLIDNSGSMRGRPIMTAAVSTEILARTLERCGIRTEILGFTTRQWKGGESQKKWKLSGGGTAPGRLNDLLHIVYKSADMPWRKAKLSLSLMLQDGLLKENIDGEALLWAYDRLRMMPEERKILIVISDGAPIDDATLSCNHGQFLEEHLHQVIHWLENKKQIELLSIGIGHDVTRYYNKAVKITDVNDLASTLVDKMIELLV